MVLDSRCSSEAADRDLPLKGLALYAGVGELARNTKSRPQLPTPASKLVPPPTQSRHLNWLGRIYATYLRAWQSN